MRRFAASIITLACIMATCSEAVRVSSPNGSLVVTFDVKNIGDAKGCAVYSVAYKDKVIVAQSRLGLDIKDYPSQIGRAHV